MQAVILDSPSTPEHFYYPDSGRIVDDAIEGFLSRCEASNSCSVKYPRLRTKFLSLLEALARQPVQVVLTKPGSEEPYEFILDRARLVDVMFEALYDPANFPGIAAAIHAAHDGTYFLLTPYVSGYLSFQLDPEFGDGMSVAINCREEVANTDLQSVPDYTERFTRRNARKAFELTWLLCDRLQLGRVGPEIKQPVRSDLPTIILSGRADPITPARLAEAAMRHLPNATLVSFSDEAHYIFYNECARAIVKLWLDGTGQGGLDALLWSACREHND